MQHVLCTRFLLCNQAMLHPIPRVPFRQHSSASQSSTGPPSAPGGEEADAPFMSPHGEGVAPSAEITPKDMSGVGKLGKVVSMEEEAAITIEVSAAKFFKGEN